MWKTEPLSQKAATQFPLTCRHHCERCQDTSQEDAFHGAGADISEDMDSGHST